MRIIAVGDLHWRSSKPFRRKDDYLSTLEGKFKSVLDYAIDNGVRLVVLPGDIFDTHSNNEYLKVRLINLIRMYDDRVKILCVAGQHDQNMRDRSLDRTSLGVLIQSNIIHHLKEPVSFDGIWYFYGCDYGCDIPNPKTKKNILVIHKMISNKDYWNGHVDYEDAENFLRKYNYDIVISGDNHKTFIVEYNGKYLFNAGSVGRQSIDQKDHLPQFFDIDLNRMTFKRIFIPIEDFESVMDTSMQQENEFNKIDNFVEFIANSEEHENIDFVSSLISFVSKLNDEDITGIIWEALSNERYN